MKHQLRKRGLSSKSVLLLLAGILAISGLALAIRPALASPLSEPQYQGTATATPGMGTRTGTPMVTQPAAVTVTGTAPAAALTRTPTVAGTLAQPRVTGTPTQLVPVTGADLNQSNPDGSTNIALWVALWLLGMLLVGFGVKSRLDRQK